MNNHMLKNMRLCRLFGTSGGVTKSTALYGHVVDMQGFERCLFLVVGGPGQEASTAAVKMGVQCCTSTGGTFYTIANSYASCTGGVAETSAWSSGGSLDAKVLAVDIKPMSSQKFLRPIMIGTSTGDYGAVLAIQYNPRLMGSTNVYKDSTASGSTTWESTKIGGQTVVVQATATTATTG